MVNSILQFQTEGVKNLCGVMDSYAADPSRIAEMVRGVTGEVVRLGLSVIAEEWESYDNLLRERKSLREGWYIERRDETSLLTSLGEVRYHKTLFKNKETGKCAYLLDKLIGVERHERLTEDAEAEILKEAAQSSYRKGGEHAALTKDAVSKETVMNKIHGLRFPEAEAGKEKKALRHLYIDADEDHVSLQYINKKGDIRKPRVNTVMPKIVYVYEGITDEGGRNGLANPKYFGGLYEGGDGVKRLWEEVRAYIDSSYDTEALEKIYINGDGAAWIKSGAACLEKGRFVLDRFHMHKYIVKATSHLKDSAEDAQAEIYRAVHRKSKKEAAAAFEKILSVTEEESRRKAVEASREYILGNWRGIMGWVKDKNKGIECSAEGHVSHVYAARMSSRPLGWSRTGADKMARLRIYEKNGGDMLELVRYQKKEMPLAAGCEEIIYSSREMFLAEKKNRERLGELADMPVYSIPYPQIKKIAALKKHIWGL